MAQQQGSYNQFGQYGQVPGQPQQGFPRFNGGGQGYQQQQYPQGTFQAPAMGGASSGSGTNTSDLSTKPPTGDPAPASGAAQGTSSTPAPHPVTSGAAGQQAPDTGTQQYPPGTFQQPASGGLGQSSTGPVNMNLGAFGAPGAWDGGYNATFAQPAARSAPPNSTPAASSAPAGQPPISAPQPPAPPQFSGGSVSLTSAGLQPTPGTVTPSSGWSVSLPTLNPSWYASQKDANQATSDQNALGSQLGGYGYAVSGGNQAAPTVGGGYPPGTFAPLQSTPVAPIFSMPTDPAGQNQRYNELLNQGYTDAQIANNPYFLTGAR